MAQISTALFDETVCDPIPSKGTDDDQSEELNDLNQELIMSIGSDGDSDSEETDILELRTKMWKDQMLLNKLEGTSKAGAEQSEQCSKPCRCLVVQQRQPSTKTELCAEDGVLHYMLKVMRDCGARGFVYGILPNTGQPITGSSDSLRAWWKDTVAFDQNAPTAVMNPEVVLRVVKRSLVSNLDKLQDMNDNTIGSILSALIQHCEPPQRSCPLDQGLAPPWWPTGEEMWWGLQGQAHAQLGPPPYRKPHDLRKGWKLSLLAAVIKHMSPRFDDMRRLVWQSKRLQHKMTAKDADTWSTVLNREQALVKETERSLAARTWDDGGDTTTFNAIPDDYCGDELTDTHKRKWGHGAEELCGEALPAADSCPGSESDRSLRNKLIGASKMAVEQNMQCPDSYQCSISDGGSKGGYAAGNSIFDYVGDDNCDTNKNQFWRSENVEGNDGEPSVPGELSPNQELDLNSTNQLLMFYPRDHLNADLGSLI